ncbi:hypothetical protein HZA96_01375 [Candidatus Woesearchaeota archaeon]|nr:hypothetical protein [Candidatus Woesearchaeota archaeon]
MAKKKRISLGRKLFFGLWFLIKLLFKGIGYFFYSIYKGIVWCIAKIKEKRIEGKEREIFFHDKKINVAGKYKELEVVETIKGDYQKLTAKLYKNQSLIAIILGARGSGKSALGMKLLENIHAVANRKCYSLGFQQKDLPTWIVGVEKVEQIENNAAVLVDEGGILFSSRSSMSAANKVLSELILIARHKDLSIFFISQNSSNIEVNTLRQADFLLLKSSSLLQMDFERKKIKEIYTDVDKKFEEHKDMLGLTYIYSDEFTGFVTNGLPSFWSTGMSKAFRGKK